MDLIENVEFWKTISASFWPATVIIMFFVAKSHIFKLFNKDGLTIKVAGMEISIADATKNIGSSVSDLQKKVAVLEETVRKLHPDAELGTYTQDLAGKNAAITKYTSETPPNKFSILWVDDYPINNAFLIDSFRNERIDVKISLNTQDALQYVENDDIDLIITDLGRKENGRENPFAGSELIKAIRSSNKQIPIIVFAGKRGLENKERLLREGANAVTASGVEIQAFVDMHKGKNQS
ncbi:MAG: response regulator [Methylocystis sp.]